MPRLGFISRAALLAALGSICQAGVNPETGSYVFRHYLPKDYGASPENWAVAQDRRGILYFGNDDGVLEFDGTSWRLIRVANGSWVRSLAVDSRGTVYVGGKGDFGLLQPDRTGTMSFVSLLDKIPAADRQFSDVWRVLPAPDGVY